MYEYFVRKVENVVDGDTIDVLIDLGFDISLMKRVRMAGIDTPESRTSDKFEKAFHFYENAKFLGSRRLKNDDWPFDIDKYKIHPEKMMESCKNILQNSKQYLISK